MTQDKEENHLIEERRKKLASLKSANMAFPNDFKKKHSAQELKEEFDAFSKGELEKKKAKGIVAGRIMLRRMMGKASFTTCLLYTSPSPRDLSTSRMPSSA